MNISQRNLSGGEIAPSLYGRTDVAKYGTAARVMRNFVAQRHGGVANRPGTEFIVEVKDSTKTVRLVKFVFNASQTYILEFGEFYVRFIRDGAQLEVTGTPYEITTPYTESDLMELQFVQSADVITIVHPDYAPRELSRTGDTAWTLTQITFGASIGSVTNLAATGSAGTDTVYYAVTAIDGVTGEEGLPAFYTFTGLTPSATDPVTLTWDRLVGASRYLVYRSIDNFTYEQIAGSGGTATTVSDTTWTTDTASIVTATTDAWVASAGQARNDVIAGGVDKPYDQRITVKAVMTVAVGPSAYGAVSGRVRAYYSRDAEPRVDAGIIFNSSGAYGNTSTSEQFTASFTVPDNGYATLTIDLVPEVYGSNAADTFEGYVDVGVGYAPYNSIERKIIGTGFTDDGTEGDPLSTPPVARNLFDGPDKYPAAVGIYQQRRLFANTTEEPETVYASRTGAYKNFLISNPLQDDDAVTWSQAGRQVNSVRHLLDLRKLVVFTVGSEMIVEGDQAGILRPDAINPQAIGYNGSGSRPPLPINDSAVYLQARGTRVRDLQPSGDGYASTELTLFAAHLFDGYTLADWDYAQTPNSVVWAVRSDGKMLGLTYMPDQEVWGWHRHDTAGLIERVCTVPEGDEDRVYLVVKRTINGSDVRYIERLHSRFFTETDGSDGVFVDCSLSYDAAPATAFSGLDHLEGEDVSVVGDGVVVANPNDADLATITVTAGAITLPVARSVVHVGLPYLSDLETLDIDAPQGQSIKDKKLLINKVNFVLEKSREFYTGKDAPADDSIDPLEGLSKWQREIEDAVSPEVLTKTVGVVIESSWNSNGRIFARVADPVPVTILAVIPQGSIP